ncbi:hypothetical protein EV356DRAFT_503930 [Viridothelium virens]|uniref:Conserved oligomeric Golgi complex subunit 1 n=1 Tax=Viridothelium virens TaxID=1048519 RepID=A0A6A6H4Z3_VIRVR|nr:hypothetical protein EV356DRAFT_503930 [Viridothelium virens]
MAAAPIDAKALNSWEDAFQHPIPVVRRLEKRLRADVEENREKLRTLVGSSYRDLLGTAGRIIEMDGQMSEVEVTLGDIGLKCNTRVLETISRNMEGLRRYHASQVTEDYSFASQLSVLQGCHAVISRLLRYSGSSLLAAKVLVIARLLHKALASSASPAPVVDSLRDKLAARRAKLLKYIDLTFANPNLEKAALVEGMHAFCLATSSTPTDVLRHFHHVRSEAISDKLRHPSNVQTAITESMKLFISTLRDTQAIFPRRLGIALETSKAQPLLQDPSILELAELQLDIHGRWIAEDIRQFTPRPRHDQLQRSDAEAMLRSWAIEAMKLFLSGLRHVLGPEKDLATLVQIRRELLRLWLSSLQPSSTSEAADVLDNLRKVLIERIADAMRDQAKSLRVVSQTVSYTISHWQAGVTDSKVNLWDLPTATTDLGGGVVQATQSILDRCNGRSKAVHKVLGEFEEWVQSVLEAQATIKKMGEMRWDEDPDDIADEILPEPPQVLLSNQDPRILETRLEDSVSEAFGQLRQDLSHVEQTLADEQQGGEKAVFLLRVLRELRQQMPRLGSALASSFSRSLQESSVEATCRRLLAVSVCDGPIDSFHQSVRQYLGQPHAPAKELWEGNPALPVQPSSAVFKFMRALMANMSHAGHDLWNPSTVHTLKLHLVNVRTASLLEVASSPTLEETPLTNGDTQVEAHEDVRPEDGPLNDEDNGTEESQQVGDVASSATDSAIRSQESYLQLLFDLFYLHSALQTKVEGSLADTDQNETIIAELSTKGDINKAAQQRLQKSAADYWKKSYLLFALLA